jgi:hypothetical protein
MGVIDYSKSKIYQIRNTITDDVFVSATSSDLAVAMRQHRYEANKHKSQDSMLLYQLMRTLGSDKFFIELIEGYPCNNKVELRARLGQHQIEKGTLNKVIAGRTKQQYMKNYREQNKEQIETYKKERVECEFCNAPMSKAYLGRHKRETVSCRVLQYLLKNQPDNEDIEKLKCHKFGRTDDGIFIHLPDVCAPYSQFIEPIKTI